MFTGIQGFTPLMSAVLGNGIFDESKGGMVDNSAVIKLLLRYMADPMLSVSVFFRIQIGIH